MKSLLVSKWLWISLLCFCFWQCNPCPPTLEQPLKKVGHFLKNGLLMIVMFIVFLLLRKLLPQHAALPQKETSGNVLWQGIHYICFGPSVEMEMIAAITVSCVKVSTAAMRSCHFSTRSAVTHLATASNQRVCAAHTFPGSTLAAESPNGTSPLAVAAPCPNLRKNARHSSA